MKRQRSLLGRSATAAIISFVILIVVLGLGSCATGRTVTPLHEAVRDGDSDGAQAEIWGGADVNAQDEEGRTPLHYACGNGDVDMVRLLLGAGADVTIAADDGNTPLHYAADNCYGEIAEMLIKSGADLAAVNNDGMTPLDLAAAIECVDLVAYFVQMSEEATLE
jgi:ankyrin repeat protein